MEITDVRKGNGYPGNITSLYWNFTIGKESVVISLDTGFQVTIYVHELDKIRPFPKEDSASGTNV